MTDTLPRPENAPPYRAHRRQTFWQILLPVILTTLALLAMGLLLALRGGAAGASLWADVALIWLILPAMLLGLLILALLAGLIYLTARVHRGTPPAAAKVQNFFRQAERAVGHFTEKIVQPVLWIEQIKASLRHLTGRQ